MMEIFVQLISDNLNGVAWILIAGMSLLMMSLYVLYRLNNKMRKEAEHMKKIQQDLRALVTASIGMGERMLEVERRNRRLADRQDQLDIYDAANQPYEQAIQMAQTGASSDELVNVCGLSKTEADLIKMIHKLDKTA
ncbi:MAG: DUF2802 domain-containing protein [Gammaproteobacteria bacterium]|nr:DUF2802 domain-containing protein [Gammaproteobacteria bacterium]